MHTSPSTAPDGDLDPSFSFSFPDVPGFFTPYRSKVDIALTFAYPCIFPFILGTLSCLAINAPVIAILAVVVSFGSLTVSGTAWMWSEEKVSTEALDVSIASGLVALASVVVPLLSIATLGVACLLLAMPITRTGATLYDYCFGSNENRSNNQTI